MQGNLLFKVGLFIYTVYMALFRDLPKDSWSDIAPEIPGRSSSRDWNQLFQPIRQVVRFCVTSIRVRHLFPSSNLHIYRRQGPRNWLSCLTWKCSDAPRVNHIKMTQRILFEDYVRYGMPFCISGFLPRYTRISLWVHVPHHTLPDKFCKFCKAFMPFPKSFVSSVQRSHHHTRTQTVP